MADMPTITCPWCGGKMDYSEYEHVYMGKKRWDGCFHCQCGAVSPKNDYPASTRAKRAKAAYVYAARTMPQKD